MGVANEDDKKTFSQKNYTHLIYIIMFAGDNLQPELHACLPIFLERLKNEITRLTAVKVLSSILDLALLRMRSL